jgi:hypothetical protein
MGHRPGVALSVRRCGGTAGQTRKIKGFFPRCGACAADFRLVILFLLKRLVAQLFLWGLGQWATLMSICG